MHTARNAVRDTDVRYKRH